MPMLLSFPLMIIPMLLWRMTGLDDLVIVNVAIACAVAEAWKATSTGFAAMLDFILSLGLAVGALFLALTSEPFKDPLFATLVMFAFADVASGSIITMRAARRDIGFNT
jgi:predicted trehalose synthase